MQLQFSEGRLPCSTSRAILNLPVVLPVLFAISRNEYSCAKDTFCISKCSHRALQIWIPNFGSYRHPNPFPRRNMTDQSSITQDTNTSLFPHRLYEMLVGCENQAKCHIVSWLPDGKAFKVHQVPEFVATILPRHFRQSKYKSFQRQRE